MAEYIDGGGPPPKPKLNLSYNPPGLKSEPRRRVELAGEWTGAVEIHEDSGGISKLTIHLRPEDGATMFVDGVPPEDFAYGGKKHRRLQPVT